MPTGHGNKAWAGFLITNGMIGVVAGLALATTLVLGNLSGLADLMRASIGIPAGWSLLGLVFGTSYGFLAAATAVMLLPGTEVPGRGLDARTRPLCGSPRSVPVTLSLRDCRILRFALRRLIERVGNPTIATAEAQAGLAPDHSEERRS
ncbi:hypothetical protein [Microvirga yunnanensis]|uniref:hypothetical protein n=1 Tax=Microvirga yunnanensis TaxID=2953740 RepID=UPI0021C90642|nr:hypothetical protein [Microvirga sp. HBU65207]